MNSCYDPLGLLACILVHLKIALRDLYGIEPKLDWDDPIPDILKENWVRLIQLLKSTESIRFSRCIKPKDAVGNPELVMFSDGSSDAMCTAAYARWTLSDGNYECRLWAAKTRVTPLKKMTIPRVEMQSAVMSTRLSKTIQEHGSLKFKNIYYIIDSTCTLALLKKNTVALKEFMGNKVTEALEVATPEQFFHVKSSDNIADLGTRTDAVLADIDRGSSWQCAPSWVRLKFEDWPVSQDSTNAQIPPEELVAVKVVAAATASSPLLVNTERFKNRRKGYEFYINLLGICINIAKAKSFRIERPLSVDDLNNAELFCLKLSMKLTTLDYERGVLKSLQPRMDSDGIIVTQSRAIEGFKLHYGRDRFPILTYRDPFAYLWMKKIHDENHTGVTTTVAKSRRKYWVIRARLLAKKIKSNCYRCRLIDKMMAEKLMAPLPLNRLKPTPA